jgi:hypothetical protein
MKYWQVGVVAVALALGACGNKSSKRSVPDDARASNTPAAKTGCSDIDECGACADSLREWMNAFVAEGSEELLVAYTPMTPVRLPDTQETVRLDFAPAITVNTKGVVFNGEFMAETKAIEEDRSGEWKIVELYERLAKEWRERTSARGAPRDVIVVVDENLSWQVLRRVVATVGASGADAAVFAFEKKTALAAPGASSIDTRIAEINADLAKRTSVLDLSKPPPDDHPLDRTYGSCKPAYDALVEAWPKGSAARAEFLETGLHEAIVACDCNIEVEAVKALHWWWSGRLGDATIATGIRVPLTGTGDATPIVVADETPWSKAHEHIVDTVGKAGPFTFGDAPKAAP